MTDNTNYEEDVGIVKDRLMNFNKQVALGYEEMQMKSFDLEEYENGLENQYVNLLTPMLEDLGIQRIINNIQDYSSLKGNFESYLPEVEKRCHRTTYKDDYELVLNEAEIMSMRFYDKAVDLIGADLKGVAKHWARVYKEDKWKHGRVTRHNVAKHWKSSANIIKKLGNYLNSAGDQIVELNRRKIAEASTILKDHQTLLGTLHALSIFLSIGLTITKKFKMFNFYYIFFKWLSWYTCFTIATLVLLSILDIYPVSFKCSLDFQYPTYNYSNFNGDLMEMRKNMDKCYHKGAVFEVMEIYLDWFSLIRRWDEYRHQISPYFFQLVKGEFNLNINEYKKALEDLKYIRGTFFCGQINDVNWKINDEYLWRMIKNFENMIDLLDMKSFNHRIRIHSIQTFNHMQHAIRTHHRPVNSFLGVYDVSCNFIEELTTKRTKDLCASMDFMSRMFPMCLFTIFVMLSFALFLFQSDEFNGQ